MQIPADRLWPRGVSKRDTADHYAYLLRELSMVTPNRVWVMGAPYTPMRRGFVFHRVGRRATRHVLACGWRMASAPMSAVAALQEAIAKNGTPETMNNDGGGCFVGSLGNDRLSR